MLRNLVWLLLAAALLLVGAEALLAQGYGAYSPLTGPNSIDRGPGFYLAAYKLFLIVLVFLLWVYTTDWISRDSLELGLEAGEKADVRSLLAGKEATLRLLSKAFEKHGIVEINPVGAPFDPQLHEAMAMQDSATAEPNTVLQVVQKGYQLNGRLLRPARVIVARSPE